MENTKKTLRSVAISIAGLVAVGALVAYLHRNAEPMEECIARLKSSAVCRESDGKVRMKDGNTLQAGERVCYDSHRIRIKHLTGKSYELGFVRDPIVSSHPGAVYKAGEKDVVKVQIPKCE